MDFKNINEKFDPARKAALDFIQVRNALGSLAVAIFVTVLGSIFAVNGFQEHDWLPMLLGLFFAIVGVCILISVPVTLVRWTKRRKLEKNARSATGEVALSDEPMVEYEFKTAYQEKLNNLMTDDSKKFGVVYDWHFEDYNLRDKDGNVVCKIHSRFHMQTLYPVTFNYQNNVSNTEKAYKMRKAIFKPSGLSLNLGKAGSISGDAGILTSEYVVDGKLYWEEFYKKGYYYDRTYEGMRSNYSIKKNGVEIFTVSDLSLRETSGVNPKFLGDLSSMGQYKLCCRESDLDEAFLFCMMTCNTYKS